MHILKRLTVMSNNRQWMISLNILIVVIMVPIAYPNETFVTSHKIESFKFSGLTDAPIDYNHLKVKQ